MQIRIDDIQSYLDCPRGYQLKKECVLPDQDFSSIDEKYIVELRRMVYFFFNQMKHNGYCDFKIIKRKWGDIWIGKRRKEDIFIPTEDPIKKWHRKRERDGIDTLFKIHSKFSKNDYDVIAVNMPYKLTIAPGITIIGRWPLIRVKDDKTEIIDFRVAEDIGSLKRDISLTAMSMAFRQTFQTNENKLIIYNLTKDRSVSTQRYDVDYDMFKTSVMDFIKCIKSSIYYRVMSKRCDSCAYSYYCRQT